MKNATPIYERTDRHNANTARQKAVRAAFLLDESSYCFDNIGDKTGADLARKAIEAAMQISDYIAKKLEK